jgi:hypothetical protein
MGVFVVVCSVFVEVWTVIGRRGGAEEEKLSRELFGVRASERADRTSVRREQNYQKRREEGGEAGKNRALPPPLRS